MGLPRGIGGLSSLISGRIRDPCSGSRVLTTGAPGNSLSGLFLNVDLYLPARLLPLPSLHLSDTPGCSVRPSGPAGGCDLRGVRLLGPELSWVLPPSC